jgi:hypothetical protein
MKRFLILLLILIPVLSWAEEPYQEARMNVGIMGGGVAAGGEPPAGIAYVDSAQGCAATGTTVTSAAFNSLTGQATLIVIAMHAYNTTAVNTAISDVGPTGNTWVKLTQRGNSPWVTLAYCIVPDDAHRSATHQVRLTISPADYISISVIAFSGTNSSQTPVENGAAGATSGTVSAGTIGDLLVTAGCSGDSGVTNASVTDGGMDGALTYWISTSTSAANSTWTLTGDTVNASAIATFQKQ